MGIDPMQMKAMVINQMIEDLKAKDRSLRIENAKILGETIGVGISVGLETKAINALRQAQKDKDEDVRKAAKEALEKINKRQF